MVNQSKANDERFWKKWKKAGAIGTVPNSYTLKLQKDDKLKIKALEEKFERRQKDVIQTQLTHKLEECKLADRISFDETALDQLYKVSSGNWQEADLYAGTAVLNALQNKKTSVTRDDIKAVDIFESIRLMFGGKDIWDDVRYIGRNVPNMLPQGVQLKRMLSEWDADRNRDSVKAVHDGRLPQYALSNKVQYDEKGCLGPEVRVPFKYDPLRDEVRAVAESVARFVAQHTGQPQEVKDISRGNDSFGIQFFVQSPAQPGRDPLLTSPNYRVTKTFTFDIEGAQGAVAVSQEILCKHDKTTLEAYVQSVKPKGK